MSISQFKEAISSVRSFARPFARRGEGAEELSDALGVAGTDESQLVRRPDLPEFVAGEMRVSVVLFPCFEVGRESESLLNASFFGSRERGGLYCLSCLFGEGSHPPSPQAGS